MSTNEWVNPSISSRLRKRKCENEEEDDDEKRAVRALIGFISMSTSIQNYMRPHYSVWNGSGTSMHCRANGKGTGERIKKKLNRTD